jgi:hypothetical protein
METTDAVIINDDDDICVLRCGGKEYVRRRLEEFESAFLASTNKSLHKMVMETEDQKRLDDEFSFETIVPDVTYSRQKHAVSLVVTWLLYPEESFRTVYIAANGIVLGTDITELVIELYK